MHGRSSSSLLLLYVGVIAAGLSVTALGLTAAVKASAGLLPDSAREKTLVDLQVQSSRDIRRALATPISVPPLTPLTAHLRETAMAQAKKPVRPKLSPEARNAMAMDQSRETPPQPEFTIPDRHTSNW
jgi:hypothetical protein